MPPMVTRKSPASALDDGNDDSRCLVGIIICEDCGSVEFPGCGSHGLLCVPMRGDGIRVGVACPVPACETSTLTSHPWNSKCRECHVQTPPTALMCMFSSAHLATLSDSTTCDAVSTLARCQHCSAAAFLPTPHTADGAAAAEARRELVHSGAACATVPAVLRACKLPQSEGEYAAENCGNVQPGAAMDYALWEPALTRPDSVYAPLR